MAALILPRRFTSQPQYPVEIDWSNPLTRGLIVCLSGSNYDLVQKKVLAGSVGRSASKSGVANSFNGTSNYLDTGRTISAGPLSGVIIAKQTAAASAGDRWGYAGNFDFGPNYNNNSHFSIADGAVTSSLITVGVERVYGFSYDGPYVTARIYADGIERASGTPYGFTAGNLFIGAQSAATGFCDVDMPYLALFARLLSKEDQYSLAQNPWQIFRRSPQVLYFDVGGGAYTLTAATGTFTETGNATSLLFNRSLPITSGSFTLTGNAASLLIGRSLTATTGAFNLTGNAATLTYATSGAYTLSTNTGTFLSIGNAANLLVNRQLPTTVGAFALAGGTTSLVRGYALPTDTGSFSLTGSAISFLYVRALTLTANTGGFNLSGKAASLSWSNAPVTTRQGDGTLTKQGIAGKKFVKPKTKEQLKLERIFGKEEEPAELVARLLEPIVDIPADIKQDRTAIPTAKADAIVAYAETYKEVLKAAEKVKVERILLVYKEEIDRRLILRRQEEELLMLTPF